MAKNRMFFTTALLEALKRQAQGPNAVTVHALYRELRDTWQRYPHWDLPRDWRGNFEGMLALLKELEAIGLVSEQRADHAFASERDAVLTSSWKLNKDWLYTSSAEQGERLDRDREEHEPPGSGSPPNDGGGGDDDGGGGFGDVLAHPHLFVVSQEDFRESIVRAMGEVE